MSRNLKKTIVIVLLVIVSVVLFWTCLIWRTIMHYKPISDVLNGKYVDKTKTVVLGTTQYHIEPDVLDDEYPIFQSWLSIEYNNVVFDYFRNHPNTSIVLTDRQHFRMWQKPENVNAFFFYSEESDCDYIYVTPLTNEAAFYHELGHYADKVTGEVSKSSEWRKIYEAEWKNNSFLDAYVDKNKGKSKEEIESILLAESFAEAFGQWNIYENNETYHKPGRLDFCTEEMFPMTYEYMADFYHSFEDKAILENSFH